MIIKKFYFSAIFLGLFLFIPFYTITNIKTLDVNFIGEISSSSLFAQTSNTELTPREFSRDEGRNVISASEVTPREFSAQEGRNVISAPELTPREFSAQEGRNVITAPRSSMRSFKGLVSEINNFLIVYVIEGFLLVILFLIFFWTVFIFIIKEGEEKAKAKINMFYSLFAVFVFTSIWAFIYFFRLFLQ